MGIVGLISFEPELQSAIREVCSYGSLRSPNEAAGVIIQNKVLEITNISPTPSDAFSIRTLDILDACEQAGIELTKELWAEAIVWHTHPGGNIGPSGIDMKNKVEGPRHLVVAIDLEQELYTPCWY